MSRPHDFIKTAWRKYLSRRLADTPGFGDKQEHIEQAFRAGWKARAERDTLMRQATKTPVTPGDIKEKNR